MKTLDQIKAETPIDPTQPDFSYPYAINTSGSYYLTGNLTVSGGNAINVNANGVTLDLNGFTISSTASAASGNGVFLNNVHDVAILNGHIVGGVTYNGSSFSGGPGFLSGIIYAFPGADPANIHVSGVSVSGCTQTGIELGSEYSDVVDHCTIRTVGGQGIHAGVVSDSTAYQCGSNAINSVTATGCYGVSVAGGHGVFSYTAMNCYGISASGQGINTLSASDCYGVSTSSTGVSAGTAQNCYGVSTSGLGVFTNNAAQNCQGVSTSGTGLLSNGNAINSSGMASGSGYGLATNANAMNCSGANTATNSTGGGIFAQNASNCVGQSFGYYGIQVNGTAISCEGLSQNGAGIRAVVAAFSNGQAAASNCAITATIGIGCTSFGGSLCFNNHYLMPP
jgi:hypothetical protein